MTFEGGFDLAGKDILSADDKQLLGATGYAQEPILVKLSDVPGCEPSVSVDRPSGLLRFAVITPHNPGATDQNLAGFSVR